MLETLMIAFREGLESFLIVAIMLACLVKTGRDHLAPAVYAGVGVALLASASGGLYLGELAEDPMWEGALALIAGGLVATMTAHVMKTAKSLRDAISGGLEKSAQGQNAVAWLGVFGFTILMICREGFETALMLGAVSAEQEAGSMLAGGAAGLALAATVGVLWIKGSHLINLRLFLQVTGISLVLFCLHLFSYGLHEMTEANILPIDNGYWHMVTEPLEPSEPIGAAILYSVVVVPILWLTFAFARSRWVATRDAAIAAPAAE